MAQAAPANAACLGFSGTADGFDQQTAVSRAQAAVADAISEYKAQKRLGRSSLSPMRAKPQPYWRDSVSDELFVKPDIVKSEILYRVLEGRGFALSSAPRAPKPAGRFREAPASAPGPDRPGPIPFLGAARLAAAGTSATFSGFFIKKDQRDDRERDHRDEPEEIVEGEHLRLAGDLMRDQRVPPRAIAA